MTELLSVSGCITDSSVPTTARLTIQIPPQKSHPRVNSAVPSKVSDFNCFGINVTGDTLPKFRSAAACSKLVALDLGLFGTSMVPITGGSIDLLVPIGSQRTIQIYGITITGTACPNPDTIIYNRTGNSATIPPMEIGRTVVDITGDTAVTINSNWNSASPIEAFCTDTVTASPSPTPSASPTPSPTPSSVASSNWDEGKWDEATWAN